MARTNKAYLIQQEKKARQIIAALSIGSHVAVPIGGPDGRRIEVRGTVARLSGLVIAVRLENGRILEYPATMVRIPAAFEVVSDNRG